MKSFSSLHKGLAVVLVMAALGGTAAARPMPAALVTTNDIAISITSDKDAVRAGQTVTYTVTMTNLGPDDATFVDVGVLLPDALVLVSVNCDRGISPDTPFCEYSSLERGGTVTSIYVATPSTAMASHSRTVTVNASTLFEDVDVLDPDMLNNTASLRTRLIGRLAHH